LLPPLRCGLPDGFQTSFDSLRLRGAADFAEVERAEDERAEDDFGAAERPTVATSLSSRGVLRFFAPLTGLARLAAAAFLAAAWRVEVFFGSVLLAARSRSSFRARGFLLVVLEEVMKPFRYL
jgi:hypothetical protein